MSMFPHTITVYSVKEDQVTFEQDANITVLRGVLVDASKGANVRETGMVNADAVTVYIPFDVEAVDGLTGAAKTYAPPVAYHRAENHAALWTLSTDMEITSHFFVSGEVVEQNVTKQGMEKNHDGVYKVTTVDTKDFGRCKHWEVGGA